MLCKRADIPLPPLRNDLRQRKDIQAKLCDHTMLSRTILSFPAYDTWENKLHSLISFVLLHKFNVHSREAKQPRHTCTLMNLMMEWNDLSKQLPESPDPSSTIASWRRGLCGFVVTDIGLAWQESCHAGLKMSKPNPGSQEVQRPNFAHWQQGSCTYRFRETSLCLLLDSCSCFKRQVDSVFLDIVGFFFNVFLGCK